jgi:tetratricopeptide (TPR) repeat protein
MRVCAGILLLAAGMLCFADSLSEALQSKRYQDALTLSDALLKTSPDSAPVWTARGFALKELQRDPESISAYETALRYSPGFLPALKGAVEVSYRSHDRRVGPLLQQLLQLEPGNVPAHGMAGVLAFESGNCSLAIQHFEYGGAETIRHSPAYSLYGVCLLTGHRLEEAITVFQKVLSDQPERSDVRFNLGYAQLVAKRTTEAADTLRPLVRPDALNLLASAEVANGQLDLAIAHLRQAIGMAPKEEQNYFDLAALFVQHDQLQAATETVDLGLRHIPEAGRLHAVRGVIEAQQGKLDEAAAEFEQSEYGAAGLGALYLQNNQTDEAVITLRERLRKEPKDPTLNYLLAQALMRQGSAKFNEARAALLIAVSAKPDFSKAHVLLGKLCIQTRDYKLAIEELKLALRDDPTNRMALSQLATALRHEGRASEAATTLAQLKKVVMQQSVQDVDPNRIVLNSRYNVR